MPRIVKGGKYIFGWSRVGDGGRIIIPGEAMAEYGLAAGDRVIITSGSTRSGGLSLTTTNLVKDTPLASILPFIPEIEACRSPAGETVRAKKRLFCWTAIEKGGCIALPVETLNKYGIKTGDLLLSVRGSNRALGFAACGPIVEEASRHPEIAVFQ